MNSFVVRNPSDIALALTHFQGEVLFLCTNQKTYEFCVRGSRKVLLLDEQGLREQYGTVNQWAYEQTNKLVHCFQVGTPEYLFLDSNYIHLKALFIQILKTVLVLEKIQARYAVDAIGLADDDDESILAMTLRAWVRAESLAISIKLFPNKKKNPTPAVGTYFKDWFYRILPIMTNRWAELKLQKACECQKKIVFVSGALNHLSPLLERLKEVGKYEILYCENSFNLEKFKYCQKSAMIFFVLKKSGRTADVFSDQEIFSESLKILYKDRDFTPIFSEVFKKTKGHDIFHYHYDIKNVKKLYSLYNIAFVLMDEDFSARRIFAALAKPLGIPSFALSHGAPVVTMLQGTKSELAGSYDTSPTFVNSEFENNLYKRIYYEPSKILMTGVPRYDAISRLTKKSLELPPSHLKKRKTILFCSSLMLGWDFEDLLTVIGYKDFMGDYARIYLNDLLDTVEPREDLCLKIKPHYHEEDEFRECFRKRGGYGKNVVLLGHKEKIFELEATADLIVTLESSVISEAMMFKKPVILLNYPSAKLMAPYDQYGVLLVATNKKELKEFIDLCLCDEAYREKLMRARDRYFQYFCGPFDGMNTERVARSILSFVTASDRIAGACR